MGENYNYFRKLFYKKLDTCTVLIHIKELSHWEEICMCTL